MEAVETPYTDYYDEKYPEKEIEYFVRVKEYAESVLQIKGGTENESSLVKIIKNRCEGFLPDSFWDLRPVELENANKFIFETYKTFTESIKNMTNTFSAKFYQEGSASSGVAPVQGYTLTDKGIWSTAQEYKDEFEQVKEFKRFLPFKKKIAVEISDIARPPGSSVIYQNIDVINSATDPLFKKFNKLEKEYIATLKETDKNMEKYKKVMEDIFDKINESKNDVKSLIKRMQAEVKDFETRWKVFDIVLRLPDDYDLTLEMESKQLLHILLQLKSEAHRTQLENMIKNWEVFYNPSDISDTGTADAVRTMVFVNTMKTLRSALFPKINKEVTARIKKMKTIFEAKSKNLKAVGSHRV